MSGQEGHGPTAKQSGQEEDGPARQSRREEHGLTARLGEHPSLEADKIRQAKPRVLAIRFAAGAMTSIVAGAVTLLFGPRVGGIMLAFPAILAASLTLIEEQEDSAEAREDARGALAGGFALGVFAVVVLVAVRSLGGAPALVLAACGWALSAVGLYRLLWWG